MGGLDLALGPLVVGAWINVLLLGLEFQQFTRYLATYQNDGWILTSLACGIFFGSTFCAMAECGGIYLYTVTNFGDFKYLLSQHWSFPSFIVGTGLCALMAQGFLVVRIWKLAANKLQSAVAIFLMGMIAISFGGSVWLASMVILHPQFQEREKVATPATVWLVASAATDLFLAAALVWQLLTIKKAQRAFGQSALQKALPRMIKSAIDTGSVTAFIALLSFSSFLATKSTNVGPGISFVLPTMYALTLFSNLNMRHSQATESSVVNSGGVMSNIAVRFTKKTSGSQSNNPVPYSIANSQILSSASNNRVQYESRLSAIGDEETAMLDKGTGSTSSPVLAGLTGAKLERAQWQLEREREREAARERELERKESV